MIFLEIIDSPDKNVLGQYKFFQNAIYLGKSTGNLLIADRALEASHMMIEVAENDLIVHPQTKVESYLLEGKRASTVRKIKIHQLITIGSTVMKVLAFEHTHFPSKKECLDEKLNKLVESSSPRLSVIEKLATLIK